MKNRMPDVASRDKPCGKLVAKENERTGGTPAGRRERRSDSRNERVNIVKRTKKLPSGLELGKDARG